MQHKPSSNGQASGGSTSRSLLSRLKTSDAAAWNRLVVLYAPLVHHWCRQFGLPTREAADVLQDVFQAVAANIERYHRDAPGDSFRGWLRAITRSKVMDHFRRRSSQPEAAGGTEALQRLGQLPAPADFMDGDSLAADQAPVRALFESALSLIRPQFEDRTWQAFWRTAVEDQPAADVAAELSMSPGAVRVAKCRVLQRLREELGEM
ncbi:MAG TPA: sigma-70 family RNA polymerase sigma factor [Pirellulaceae bacterium]|nr:sigma-70 family RNA polymerase sigma factor [Pirellulaceae bacterium]